MKKTKIILITLMFIITIVGISYGTTDTYEIKMEASKKEYLTGETIIVPIKIENIKTENGIVAFSTFLSFDEEVFEEPEIMEGANWAKPNIVEHFIQSTTSTMQPVKENQEVLILSFKIKEDAKLGNTKIALSKFETSDGENTTINEGSSIEVNITSTKAKVAEVIIDNIWFNERNITITAIISTVTLFIIVFITIYYIQHREKKEEKSILYEEVKGIPDNKEQDNSEEKK